MESICSVYILTLPNNKIYVGYTSMSPDELWADNGDVYEDNKRLYPDIQVAGWNNIKREIVYINLSRSDALEKKKELCLKYKSYLPEYGYNRPCDAGIKKEATRKQNTIKSNAEESVTSYIVYALLMPNKKIYIGLIKKRNEHMIQSEEYYIENQILYEDICSYGFDEIKTVIICDELDEKTALNLRKNLIRRYQTNENEYGYNNNNYQAVRKDTGNYTVYLHKVPNGKIYVGQTSKTVKSRWGENGNKYSENKEFYDDIQKYGWENIEHLIVCKNLFYDQAMELEKSLISIFKSNEPEYGYNKTAGGEKFIAKTKKDSITKQIHNVDKLYLAEDNKYYQSEKSYLNKKDRNRILDDYTMSFVKITDKGLLAIIRKRAKQYNNNQLIKMTEILKTNEKYITNIIKTKRFENNYGKIGYIEKIILNKANE